MSAATRGFTLVTYVARLDVPRHVVVSCLLAAHRRRIGTARQPGPRPVPPHAPPVPDEAKPFLHDLGV